MFALLSISLLLFTSCGSDDNITNEVNHQSQIDNNSLKKSKDALQFDYGNNTFVKNGDITSLYVDSEWKNDITLSDYNNFSIDDKGNEVYLNHQNGIDYIKLSNFRDINGKTIFDVLTSNGTTINGISSTTHRGGPGWWAVVIDVIMWLSDHLTSTEGGSLSDCRQALSDCPRGGAMQYETGSNWFGQDSQCKVICY